MIGGLIGGLIVGAIEKSKAGELVAGPKLTPEAAEQIMNWAQAKVSMAPRDAQQIAQSAPPQTTIATSADTPSEPTTPDAPVAPDASRPDENISLRPAGASSGEAPMATPAPSAAVLIASSPSPMKAKAERVATQLGCDGLTPGAAGGFTASCGSYGVAIECDADRCYPTHTIKLDH